MKSEDMKREIVALRKRVAELETELLNVQLSESSWSTEKATLTRQVANLTRDNENLLERIEWVAQLASRADLNPLDLRIRKLRPGQRTG